MKNEFLKKITEKIEENISNDQFGVSELANEIGMSRSNLLRKIKTLTTLSASQFIRQVRLKQAMEILKQTSFNVSEVAYKVGFSSTSYFIKCFGDFYGYSPGEVGKIDLNESVPKAIDKSSYTHQLSAIMFTDIQGYTALMQQDEEKALNFRNRHREVFNVITKKFGGKILQYFGDGTLSTFNSAIDAVRCGIELQSSFQENPKIPVRIGIHSGDIIFTEDDIIGDGVNVASRIESLAASGSVFISEKVYDEVKNQTGIQTISMGVFELKNVDKPIEVFAITNPGLVVPDKGQISGKVKSKSILHNSKSGEKGKWILAKWAILLPIIIFVGYLVFTSDILDIKKQNLSASEQSITKKSIAVLPFLNDSYDSSNVYIINGLMESILNNLQKIEDLRVISRTSVERYRNTDKTISEIAEELNVRYLIEGSGQKIDDQILLHIQLIDASDDKHLWSEQYNRKAEKIFNLQTDIAKNIVDEIEVIITPEEEVRINKSPTENLVAYDYFLKGLDLLNKPDHQDIEDAIPFFEKAIENDPEYARAHAAIAIAYYLMDKGQAEKKHSSQINHYADKAILLDSELPQSLIAKALFYMHNKEYGLAVSFLEKALEFNPNSDLVFVFLVELYVHHIPDTEKYLEYTLRGLQVDFTSYDSVTTSFSYLHISNAFIQSGFIDQAEKYIIKSLEYDPQNLYSEYVMAYILFSKNRDLGQLKNRLIECLQKDSTRLDIMQEVGKVNYYLRDYESAYTYYKKFMEIKELYKLDIFNSENAKIGVVLSEIGLEEESDRVFKTFKNYAENDQSIYKHLSLSVYYSQMGDAKSAIEHFRLFSQEDNYHFWTILFLEMDPLVDNIKDLPEFKEIYRDIENKFWDKHKQLKATLEGKGLI